MSTDDVRNKLLARRRGRIPATTIAESEEVTEEVAEESPRLQSRDRSAEATALAVEGTNFIATLARHLGAGRILMVHVDPNNDNIVRIELHQGTGMPVPKRRKLGPDYYLHICNPEYWNWESKWKVMSQEEKIEYATTLGVAWELHENPKINNMRLTEAVRSHEGVDKYKPQYSTVSQRKDAKTAYLADQLDMSDNS